MILTDTFYSYQSIIGAYFPGNITDLGWFVTYILTGLAGYFQAHTLLMTESEKRKELTLPGKENTLQKVLSYIPYLWLIFAFSLLNPIWNNSIHLNRTFLYFGVALIGVMVVIRQILALEENRFLNRRLEAVLGHIQKQAVILEQTNKDLECEIVTRRKAEEQLSYEALHDPLTNLPNRTLLTDRIDLAIENSKNNPDVSYSVLFLDVDQFKVINDSLGHSLGDQLLNVVAQRLQECLRSSDTAARLGGDEFVILLENSSKTSKEETISFIVNRLQDQIQQVVDLEGHSVFFTTSIGIVLDVSTYKSSGDVLRDADIAMYRAKALGKDRYEIFHEGLRAQAYTRMEIDEDLHYALENKEFVLNFQPIVKLDRYKLMGLNPSSVGIILITAFYSPTISFR
jgi:diguanylate cyclase (GGDEF)-like protein